MKKNKMLMTVAVLILCVASVFLVRTLRPDPKEAMKKRLAERSAGEAAAKIWVTEYFDYQCPPCANANTMLHEWMAKNPGKLYLQLRYFPLPNHRNAMKAAVHAECASRQPGKFWKFHDVMLSHQTEWAQEAYPEMKFLTYAQEAGLDLTRWDACTKDPATERSIAEEKAQAEKLGISITPSFFVNGKLVVGTKDLFEALETPGEKPPAA